MNHLMSAANQFMIDNALPGNIIDLGACRGAITIPIAQKLSGTPYSVYAVEPDADAIYFLRENTKDYTNVKTFNFGIMNENSTGRLFLSQMEGHTTVFESAATRKWNYDPDRYRPVEYKTMDTFVEENRITNITGMKIDVEAAEQFVLEGGEKTFTENKILIALETHDNVNFDAVYALLKKYGYNVYTNSGELVDHVQIDRDYICKNY